MKSAVFEAFDRFEKEGITDRDVERIKATLEKRFYENLGSILNKSINLGFYNTFLNDPGYIEKDIENIKAVSREDILKVYDEYIKGKESYCYKLCPEGKN